MQISKDTLAGRTIVACVYVAVVVLTAGGILVGVWTAKEMTSIVTEQFNAQQMVIAQTARARVERELGGVKRALFALAPALEAVPLQPRALKEVLQPTLPGLQEGGVRRVEVVDRVARRAVGGLLQGSWSEHGILPAGIYDQVRFNAGETLPLWTSPVQTASDPDEMLIVAPLARDGSRLLIFQLNVSTLLSSIFKNIQSGKSGYAWVIDQDGTFLFHPNADFIGRDAFSVREEKFPDISYERINFIQKEKMLKGEQGTGWFYSGWHRGVSGPTKKLIAYSPIHISDNPPRFWSVAVVAPESEVQDALRRGYFKLFLLLGLVVLAVALGAAAIIWLENRWSSVLEAKVIAKTDALAKSEEKYRSLVESAEDFIFTVDREGRFQSLNTFTANFFGGPPDRFIGQPLDSAIPESQAQHQTKLISQVYRSGKSLREELELPMADRSAWISANFMPVKTETGEVATVLCIARDVTETKNLQRRLVNAEKLASLGTLAAGVAHEINNPLGVILGFCELLLRKAQKGTQLYDDLQTIERQGLHCKETVENLLTFARTEKQLLDYSDVNTCVEEIVKIVRHLLEKNGIQLALELGDGLPPVKGDAHQLQQVFLNLITNALAAMEHGGVLTIRTYLERSARRAVIQFQDTGVGIPTDHLDHIFEPFFTTKPEGQGTGLGLFVSYGIVASYGGTIECTSTTTSRPGRPSGSVFTVKLLTRDREK